jgi:hypothetical protein
LLLDHFANATGLQINYSKSTAVLIHMDEDNISDCITALGFHYQTRSCVYRLLRRTSLNVIDTCHLAGWQSALMNQMGEFSA